MMNARIGDEELDTLLTAYGNAVFACGEWSDEAVEDMEFATYEGCMLAASKAHEALIAAIRKRLSLMVTP